MSFIPAKCTECGASIEVDDTKEAGICKHCGTAFVTEKAINNYNTIIKNTTIINGENVAIIDAEMQKMQKTYEFYIEENKFAQAKTLLDKYLSEYPYDKFGYEQKIAYIINLYSQPNMVAKISFNDLYDHQYEISNCLDKLKKINPKNIKNYQDIVKPFHENFDNLVKQKKQLLLDSYKTEDMKKNQQNRQQLHETKQRYLYTQKKAKKYLIEAILLLVCCVCFPILSFIMVVGLANGIQGGIGIALLYSVILTAAISLSGILPLFCKKKFQKYKSIKKEADSYKWQYEHLQ